MIISEKCICSTQADVALLGNGSVELGCGLSTLMRLKEIQETLPELEKTQAGRRKYVKGPSEKAREPT